VEQDIEATVGRPFGLILADRPGSGHVWSCREVPDGIEFVCADYVADVPPGVGSARDKEFRFVADRAGVFVLVFELKRSWEATYVEKRSMRVRVHPAARSPSAEPTR